MPHLLPSVIVTSRESAGQLLASSRSGGIVAVISIGSSYETPCDGFAEFPARKLRLVFDDVERDLFWVGLSGCTWADMRALVAFYETIPARGTVLVHCAAGVSRSSASALGFLVARLGDDHAAVDALLENIELAREQNLRSDDDIWPNRRVVWMLDRLLAREGKLVGAYKSRWPRVGDLEVPEEG